MTGKQFVSSKDVKNSMIYNMCVCRVTLYECHTHHYWFENLTIVLHILFLLNMQIKFCVNWIFYHPIHKTCFEYTLNGVTLTKVTLDVTHIYIYMSYILLNMAVEIYNIFQNKTTLMLENQNLNPVIIW